MTKSIEELSPEELMVQIKKIAVLMGNKIVEVEKKLHHLEMAYPKNAMERVQLNLMRLFLRGTRKVAQKHILLAVRLAKASGIDIKKEDLNKIKEVLGVREEGKTTKKISHAKVNHSLTQKQRTRE